MIWLKCDGDDTGHVYFHDGEGRSAWDDDMFYRMYPNIHPENQTISRVAPPRQAPRQTERL